jgi:hypothetical protein
MLISRYRLFETRIDPMPPTAGVTDGIVDPAGTKYSNKMMLSTAGQLAFTLETTGTLAGTFTLWYSDEDQPGLADDTDWVQDSTITFTQPAGSATHIKYAVTDIPGAWYRIKYVHTSGTGSLKGYASRANGD